MGAPSVIDRLRGAIRFDGWLNLLTGVGSGVGRTAFQFLHTPRLPDDVLEDLYYGDPYASRICRVVPEEALRRPFTVKTDAGDLGSALAARLDDLGARAKLLEAWTWARVFGGAALFVGADDGRPPHEPLDRAAVRTVAFLTVVDKRELVPHSWVGDALSPRFGEPETYRLTRAGTGGGQADPGAVVHASRLIRFDGPLTGRRRRAQNHGWSDSELQRVWDALQQFNGAWASAASLLQDASQGVFRIKDLMSLMAGDAQGTLQQRLQLIDMSRSVAKAILIDAEGESFERVETNLTGLPDVVDKFLLRLAGAAEIPVTILMGQAPAGLNATGDSDVRWFYDRIASAQENYLRPRAERLVRLLLAAHDGPTGGLEPKAWSVQFPPLWQPTEPEKATLRAAVAQTDVAYIQAGVLTPEEVSLSRFRPDGWSMETQVELAARHAIQAADRAAAAAPPPPPQATPPAQTPPPAPPVP